MSDERMPPPAVPAPDEPPAAPAVEAASPDVVLAPTDTALPGAHRGGFRRELTQPLPVAPLRSVAGQALEPRFDFAFMQRDLRGLRPLGCLFPFGQARKQPFLGPVRLAHMRAEHTGPRPAQSGERLQRRPGALALGPVFAFAIRQQRCSGGLQQSGDGIVAGRFVQTERVRQTFRRGHDEARRMNEREQLEQVEPGEIGVAQPAGDQRRVEQQQRSVRGGHDRIALGNGSRAAVAAAQPATGVAGVKRGKCERVHRGTMLWGERKVNAGRLYSPRF